MGSGIIMNFAASFLAGFALTCTLTGEALPQGSMAPEVRVVIVKPSGTVKRLDAARAREKAAQAEAKDRTRQDREALKAQARAKAAADKAYTKKWKKP